MSQTDDAAVIHSHWHANKKTSLMATKENTAVSIDSCKYKHCSEFISSESKKNKISNCFNNMGSAKPTIEAYLEVQNLQFCNVHSKALSNC